MTIDESIAKYSSEAQAFREQLGVCEKQIAALQQRRENLILAMQRADGALAALQELSANADSVQEGVE